jgi:hypothetical protein
MMRIVCRGLLLSIATLALAAGPASAQTFSDHLLNSPDQVVSWQGKTTDPTGQGYGPPLAQTCTDDTCDTFPLRIDLPAGTFKHASKNPAPDGVTRMQAEGPTDMPGDGVLISIKWPTDFDQWNLFVEDESTGQTVAQGFDLDSNAQSVLLPHPHNGVYKVTIVPFYTDFDKVDQNYQGEARVWLDPSQQHDQKTQLLPRIQTMPPSNFHIADVPPIPSNPTGWRFTSPGTFSTSCYADETAQFGSQRCLRFDNTIRNTGDGPLVLRFAWSPDSFTNNCKMQQEILSSDATVTDRDAGPCVFHPQHAHFHYQNMGIYQLYPVGSDGAPAVKPVAQSRKVGFCTIDVDYFSFGTAHPGGPRTYSFPTCNVPNAYDSRTDGPYGPTSPPEYMGISAGWADIYTWDLPAQYIDITTGVPDGVYEIVSRSNPDGGILTSDRGSETGVTCVELKGTTVKTVKEFPSQADNAPLPSCGSGNVLAAHTKHVARRHHAKRHRHHAKRHRHHAKRHHHRRSRRHR